MLYDKLPMWPFKKASSSRKTKKRFAARPVEGRAADDPHLLQITKWTMPTLQAGQAIRANR
jgi:hypothetical protein